MSKKTIIATVASIALTVFAVQGVVMANGHGNQGSNGGYHQMYKNVDDLTDAQKSEMTKLHETHMKVIEPIELDLVKKQAAYRALMQNDNPNPDEASKLAGEVQTLKNKLRDEMTKFRTKVESEFGLEHRKGYHDGGRKNRGSDRDDNRNRNSGGRHNSNCNC